MIFQCQGHSCFCSSEASTQRNRSVGRRDAPSGDGRPSERERARAFASGPQRDSACSDRLTSASSARIRACSFVCHYYTPAEISLFNNEMINCLHDSLCCVCVCARALGEMPCAVTPSRKTRKTPRRCTITHPALGAALRQDRFWLLLL